MKKLIILIALLIPSLVFGQWGVKPKSTVTVSGTVTIDSTKTRKLVSVDVLPAITGTVTATIDSTKLRKLISIDNISYTVEDSLGITSITGNDSSSVTSTVLGNVNGILRVGIKASVAVDSVDFFFNFGSRTIQKFLYADTVQVKGSETAYVKADNITLTANQIYWCILYDPDATQPINYIPTANRTMTVEVVQRGTDTNAGYTIFIQRQVN